MQRRMTGLIAAGAALGMTVVLAGCGNPGGSEVTKLTLVAADYGTSAENTSRKYWDKVIDAFEEKHSGIDVEVTVLSWNDVDAEVKKMVDAGDAPDLAQIGAYADYAAAEELYTVEDLLSIQVHADFLPTLSDAGEVARVQYGMPFASSTRLLFYNKDLFERAGITKAPRTWDELQEAARLLKDEDVLYPYALPLGPEEAQGETLMWLLSGGAGYTDDIGSYRLDSEANVRTFDWLKDELVGEGLTGPVPPAELNRADAFAAFTDGKVGMLNGHPTLMQKAAQKGVDFGMVPMPGIKGEADASMGVADWMMAFRQNGHQDEIGEFLDFVYAKENVLDFSRRYDMLPVTVSAAEEMAGNEDDAALVTFLDGLPSAQLYPVGKTSWAQVSADIKRRIGTAVTEGGDPAVVLNALQRGAARADQPE
ncbi:ABC transporter substrate-binding protein [Streptomyces uncialis]|uniref:ABC transporter substrate-binding protein n=1 Tax=Streptomyces uncialis TaxID=1048205 RepID=UPI003827D601